eukprot:CAMPEP_0197075094 /NCGR_PEP_ID=MMETSP1384-20130603/211437_1 /TAXON_ID=29189 /ORGANISM="Ammonia sp." /LENGTH=333 /DNA_ID=CAMNT_0042513937 /DNA_START=57 /DNA_END=1059 /DNA_ORIENTATION=-
MADTSTDMHETEALHSENVVLTDDDSDNDGDGAVRVIQQSAWKRSQIIKWCLFAALATVLLVGVVAALALLFDGSEATSDVLNAPDSIDNYVLPNTTLSVTINTDTTIKGEFVVTDVEKISYDFVSISNSSAEYIEFQTTSVLFAEWRGFKIYHLHEDDITMQLFDAAGAPYTIRIGRARNMSDSETATLESFLSNLVCEHFVELSIKLGAVGYLGDSNQAIQDIHRFALWIWNVVASDGNIDISQWVDLDEEFEKVNTVNAASKKAGVRVQNMEQLMIHSSSEVSSWNTGKKYWEIVALRLVIATIRALECVEKAVVAGPACAEIVSVGGDA